MLKLASREDIQMKGKKKNLVLIFALAGLTVSVICLAGVNYKLQRDYNNIQKDYDDMSEAFQSLKQLTLRLVNEQWTDNTGSDSKYVNFKAGLYNIGYGKAYNVTLIVLVHGLNNTLLERQEFPIGELDVLQYHDFEVNIEYSGILSYVSAGYSWD